MQYMLPKIILKCTLIFLYSENLLRKKSESESFFLE